jgi:excisionase family DNA binding protein
MHQNEYVSPATGAHILGVGLTLFRALLRDGKIASVKLGHRTRRVSLAEIRRFIEREAAKAKPDTNA